MKALFNLILCSMMLFGSIFPATAMEETSSYSLSPSTIFMPMRGDGDATTPKANLGASLKKVGFLLDSQTQKQYKFYRESTLLYTKIYKKGDFIVEYSYILDSEKNPFFISLKITFPTISSCETFYKDVVKRVKDNEKYWEEEPGGFSRGEWKYGKNKCERLEFSPGGNEYWRCNGKIFTYNYEVLLF